MYSNSHFAALLTAAPVVCTLLSTLFTGSHCFSIRLCWNQMDQQHLLFDQSQAIQGEGCRKKFLVTDVNSSCVWTLWVGHVHPFDLNWLFWAPEISQRYFATYFLNCLFLCFRSKNGKVMKGKLKFKTSATNKNSEKSIKDGLRTLRIKYSHFLVVRVYKHSSLRIYCRYRQNA